MLRNSFARFLRNLSSLSSKEQQIRLGRWNVRYDEKTIANTVRWANEDHCGVCSQEFKYEEQNQNKSNKQKEESVQQNKNNEAGKQGKQGKQDIQKITMANCCGNGCPTCPTYIEFVCSTT